MPKIASFTVAPLVQLMKSNLLLDMQCSADNKHVHVKEGQRKTKIVEYVSYNSFLKQLSYIRIFTGSALYTTFSVTHGLTLHTN